MAGGMQGGCMCGAVRYEIAGAPMMVGNCFCIDCRKASGTSHSTHAIIPATGLAIAGATRAYASPADRGSIVTRHFCPECGCAIHSTNSGMPGTIAIRVSSLDDLDAVEPQMTVYASRAPSWALIDRTRPVFAEMPEGGPQSVMPGS
jgi:hypothetical protein